MYYHQQIHVWTVCEVKPFVCLIFLVCRVATLNREAHHGWNFCFWSLSISTIVENFHCEILGYFLKINISSPTFHKFCFKCTLWILKGILRGGGKWGGLAPNLVGAVNGQREGVRGGQRGNPVITVIKYIHNTLLLQIPPTSSFTRVSKCLFA